MKKRIILILVYTLVFSLSGCGSKTSVEAKRTEDINTTVSVTVPVSTTAPVSPGRQVIEFYNDPEKSSDLFVEEILPFAGEILERELSPEIQTMISQKSANSALTAEYLVIDGTPIYTICKDDSSSKPLVILLHGGGSSKDQNVIPACDMAMQGIYAVCIDSAGCGDSEKGPLDALASFAETVYQINSVIEYCNTLENVDAASFGIYGCSMGANIAYAYVAHGLYCPKVISVELGTPDYTTLGNGPLYDCFSHGNSGQPQVMNSEEIMEFAQLYSPIRRPERFLDVFVYAFNGMNDSLTPSDGCIALEAKVKELGGNKFNYEGFDGYGHEGLPCNSMQPLVQNLLNPA